MTKCFPKMSLNDCLNMVKQPLLEKASLHGTLKRHLEMQEKFQAFN